MEANTNITSGAWISYPIIPSNVLQPFFLVFTETRSSRFGLPCLLLIFAMVKFVTLQVPVSFPQGPPKLGRGLAVCGSVVDTVLFEGSDLLSCDPADGTLPAVEYSKKVINIVILGLRV